MGGCKRCGGGQYLNVDGDANCMLCGEIEAQGRPYGLPAPCPVEKRKRGRPLVLASSEIAALLAAYDAGTTETVLAARYGLNRTTLRGYLERAGRRERCRGREQ